MFAIFRFGKENGRLLLDIDDQYTSAELNPIESLRGVSQYTGLSDARVSSWYQRLNLASIAEQRRGYF